MRRAILAGLLVAGTFALGDTATAQEPVIKRSAPMTLTGELVDISCYKSKGVAGGTGAAHVECAVGILSDGDGLFKIWGAAAKDKYAKVMPYIGQQVEITGTEVTLSNNYDVRSFDLQTVKRKGK